MFVHPVITTRLLDAVKKQYELDINGLHGITHWQRVEAFALEIAKKENLDSPIFSLFALFHDACRKSESIDRDHGKRAVTLIHELKEEYLDLSGEDLAYLCEACEGHTSNIYTDNPIIGVCWDADRLDLPRANIQTDKRLLNTNAAKKICDSRE